MSYVTRERIAIEISINNGAPQSLTLELIGPTPSTTKTLVRGVDEEIESVGVGGYRYQFTAADTDAGVYQYRWFGVDALGIEFAEPSSGGAYKSFRVVFP